MEPISDGQRDFPLPSRNFIQKAEMYFPHDDLHLISVARPKIESEVDPALSCLDERIHGINSVERVHQLRRKHWIMVHVPFSLVVLGILISMSLICWGYWRKGTTIMGCDALFAGIIRWSLADARAGLLMVGSKLKDTCIYLILGVLMIYLSLTISALH